MSHSTYIFMASQEIEWLLKEKYNGEKSDAFFADCKALALGKPLAYLIGWVPFLDCKIWLDTQPLIPRPETEYWVEEAIKVMKEGQTLSLGIESTPVRVLDLCAGSGCIGIAVAKAIPEALVDFSEIDSNLLPTINKNIKENLPDTGNYQVKHSNLFSVFPDKYDFIFSNPPYIDPAVDRTGPSVKKYEPYVALFGGEKGMEIINEIISKTPAHLASGGQLWLEHEPEQSDPIKEIGKEYNFTCSTLKDQYGVERYSILVLQ